MNCKPVSEPNSESKSRPIKQGYFYGGNKGKSVQQMVKEEGSLGFAVNQGQKRFTPLPPEEEGYTGHEEKSLEI